MANRQQWLFENQTSDDVSARVTWQGGGVGTVIVYGTWGGGTVTIQASADLTTWVDLGSDLTFTADGIGNFDLAPGVTIRAELSGSTGAAIYAKVF